jgi:hypothetical protein
MSGLTLGIANDAVNQIAAINIKLVSQEREMRELKDRALCQDASREEQSAATAVLEARLRAVAAKSATQNSLGRNMPEAYEPHVRETQAILRGLLYDKFALLDYDLPPATKEMITDGIRTLSAMMVGNKLAGDHNDYSTEQRVVFSQAYATSAKSTPLASGPMCDTIFIPVQTAITFAENAIKQLKKPDTNSSGYKRRDDPPYRNPAGYYPGSNKYPAREDRERDNRPRY